MMGGSSSKSEEENHRNDRPHGRGPPNPIGNDQPSPGHHRQPANAPRQRDRWGDPVERPEQNPRGASDYQQGKPSPQQLDRRGGSSSYETQPFAVNEHPDVDRFGNPCGPVNDQRFSQTKRPLPPDPKPQEKSLYDIEALAEMEKNDPYLSNDANVNPVEGGIPYDKMSSRHDKPLRFQPMKSFPSGFFFLIKPFEYNSSRPNEFPSPISDTYKDYYDPDHVLMPCSPRNLDKENRPKWPKIKQALAYLEQICHRGEVTLDLVQKVFNDVTESNVELTGFIELIERGCKRDEKDRIMKITLPFICNLAMNVHRICSESPRVLRHGKNESVTMSQLQAASLLACSFFCLYPDRPEWHKRRGGADRRESSLTGWFENFPSPNFFRLYQGRESSKIEKIKSILHYFRRISESNPTGVITFRRHVLAQKNFPRWDQSRKELCELHLTSAKKIEDFPDSLQVDFANKFIGGGVLGHGCVQEEIRFTICPEMIVSVLLCQKMEDNEAIFLIGCERYSNYDGYANSFKFSGNYQDQSPKDNWGRRSTHLVAMDAVEYRDPRRQYEYEFISRELIKAFTAFAPSDTTEQGHDYPIITGNWGCGAFNGDRQLKALIQIMAASEAERPLTYAAYGDRNFVLGLIEVYNYLNSQGAKVSDLYRYIMQYSKRRDIRQSLFDMVMRTSIQQIRK